MWVRPRRQWPVAAAGREETAIFELTELKVNAQILKDYGNRAAIDLSESKQARVDQR
jgi:hypothetical protein